MKLNTMSDGAEGNSATTEVKPPYWAEVLEAHNQKQIPLEGFFKLQYKRRDGSTATGWFFKPEYHSQPHIVYSRVLSNYRAGKVLEAGQCVLNDCWACGDDDFKNMKSLVHITAARDLTNHVDFLEQVEDAAS